MKSLKIIVFYLLCIPIANAQNWCPPGAEWFYTADCLQMTNGYYHLYYDGDTTINSITCKIIQKNLSYKDILGNLVTGSAGREYTYADNDKVYIYRFNDFYPLYNFIAQAGDTITIYGTDYYTNCDSVSLALVTNTGIITINNQNLRYYELNQLNNDNPEWSHNGTIIEKIGHLNAYFLPTKIGACGIGFDSGCESGFFRCYQDNGFGLYSTVTPLSCDYLLSATSTEQKQITLSVYPNPSTGIFNINIEDVPSIKHNVQCRVYDIAGKELYNSPLQRIGTGAELNLNHLQNGIYLLQLTNGEQSFTQKIVIEK